MAVQEFDARVKHKRDTDTAWEAENPILLDGEIIIVDTADGETRRKIGDGVTPYSMLPFEKIGSTVKLVRWTTSDM